MSSRMDHHVFYYCTDGKYFITYVEVALMRMCLSTRTWVDLGFIRIEIFDDMISLCQKWTFCLPYLCSVLDQVDT